MKKMLLAGLFAFWGIISSGPAFALNLHELQLQADLMQHQADLMAHELEALKSHDGDGSAGVGHDRLKIHGYGELHYTNYLDENDHSTEIDQHRFALGIHALLADWVHFTAEINFEHAAQKLEFELAYLDFLIHETFNARAGVVYIPVGFLNEAPQPNLFWSVERPQFQTKIIPTSWSGAGAGIFGTPMQGVNYRIYVVNSVQSIRKTGFSGGEGVTGNGGDSGQFKSSSGIRSGRRQINELIAEDFSATGRLELTRLFPGLKLGFSFYTGNTTHDIINEGGFIFLIEGDMRYRLHWFEMNASIANIDIDDARALNAFCASAAGDCTSDVADNIFGWNVQAGVHVPELLGLHTSHDVVLWFMFEHIRPQDGVPSGTPPTAGVNFDVYQAGIVYLPIPEVAIKLDWQHRRFRNPADLDPGELGRAADTINIGLAYSYH